MSITDLINELDRIRAIHGEIDVITYDYAGGNDEENEPLCNVKEEWNGRTETCVVLNA